jgi:hypothetical protein
MLLGTQRMGWVAGSSCRPATFGGVQAAMVLAWAATPTLISSASLNILSQQDQYQFACISSLKQCQQLQAEAAGGSMQTAGGTVLSRGEAERATVEVVKQQLLVLEVRLPPDMLGGSGSSWWCDWRAQVAAASTPQQLGAQVRLSTHAVPQA